MDFLSQPFYKGPTSGQIIKRRINKTSNFHGLSAKDNLLNNLINVLKNYSVQNEGESLARSIMNIEGIQNKNVNYLAAALYLHYIYSKKSKQIKIDAKMFSDDSNAMKTIKQNLGKSTKTVTEKTEKESWIRKKINIFTYFQEIILFLEKDYINYDTSRLYKQQQEIEDDESEEDESDVEDEMAVHNGYGSDPGREGEGDDFDPSN